MNIDWKPDNFIYAKIGYMLLKLLIKTKEGRKLLSDPINNFLDFRKSYLQDLKHLLKSLISNDASHEQVQLLNFENFQTRMIREYISWIGLFSESKPGLELLQNFEIFETFKCFVTISTNF